MSRFSFNRKRAETQAGFGDSRATCAIGGGPGRALDAGADPLAGRRPRQGDRARDRRVLQPRPAQRGRTARGHLIGRDGAEVGRLYPRLSRRYRQELRYPACKPARQSALDSQHHDHRRRRADPVLDQRPLYRPRPLRPSLFQERTGEQGIRLLGFSAGETHQQADGDGRLPGVRDQHGCRRRRAGQHQSRLDVQGDEQFCRPARHLGCLGRTRKGSCSRFPAIKPA